MGRQSLPFPHGGREIEKNLFPFPMRKVKVKKKFPLPHEGREIEKISFHFPRNVIFFPFFIGKRSFFFMRKGKLKKISFLPMRDVRSCIPFLFPAVTRSAIMLRICRIENANIKSIFKYRTYEKKTILLRLTIKMQ